MLDTKIEFQAARKATSANKERMWTATGKGTSGFERSSSEFPKIAHRPKFKIERTARFFTIGSCFAREIEKALGELGIDCLTSRVTFPGHLYEHQQTRERRGALNAYTPASIRELVKLPQRDDAETVGALQIGNDEWCDMLLSGLRFLPHDELKVARGLLLDVYRLLPQSDVVIITLGYTESWFDIRDGIYVNRSPGASIKTARLGERYQFANFGPAAVIEAIEDTIVTILDATQNRAKIVITTSPVPLHGTFTERDVICANQYSKSTLVSAANYVASRHDYVDYFPSYEFVTAMDRNRAFRPDGIHVQRDVVQRIMETFTQLYLIS